MEESLALLALHVSSPLTWQKPDCKIRDRVRWSTRACKCFVNWFLCSNTNVRVHYIRLIFNTPLDNLFRCSDLVPVHTGVFLTNKCLRDVNSREGLKMLLLSICFFCMTKLVTQSGVCETHHTQILKKNNKKKPKKKHWFFFFFYPLLGDS